MGVIVTPQVAKGIVTVSKKRSAYTRSHFFLAVLLSFVFVAVTAAVGFHAYIAWLLGRPVIAPLSSNPLEAIGVPYEDLSFPSANKRSNLEGWYLPAEHSKRTVIFSHGYGANREESWVPMYDLAKAAHMQNFNVLMFDYGFVHPEQVVTGGVQETFELLGAIDVAKEKGAEQIFIWGFSMGAGTALGTALQSGDITAMILDSAFILSPDTLYYNIRQHADLPRFPSVGLLRLFFPMMNGVSMNQLPYERVLNTSYEIPLFLIHGMQDEKAPYQLAKQVFNNQSEQALSKLWILPDGHHELIYTVNKREYLQKTLSFLESVSAGIHQK
ncbi:MAG: hypothetical protein K0R57_5884 [Paenibacillaceae bacterium]|nr:hypothetical protein [Paenibacillaceae bacterium]